MNKCIKCRSADKNETGKLQQVNEECKLVVFCNRKDAWVLQHANKTCYQPDFFTCHDKRYEVFKEDNKDNFNPPSYISCGFWPEDCKSETCPYKHLRKDSVNNAYVIKKL